MYNIGVQRRHYLYLFNQQNYLSLYLYSDSRPEVTLNRANVNII